MRQGDELLFTMTGGISISEDPTFRFAYTDNGGGRADGRATDTEGGAFEGGSRSACETGSGCCIRACHVYAVSCGARCHARAISAMQSARAIVAKQLK